MMLLVSADVQIPAESPKNMSRRKTLKPSTHHPKRRRPEEQ
jgi:hypothetical protein